MRGALRRRRRQAMVCGLIVILSRYVYVLLHQDALPVNTRSPDLHAGSRDAPAPLGPDAGVRTEKVAPIPITVTTPVELWLETGCQLHVAARTEAGADVSPLFVRITGPSRIIEDEVWPDHWDRPGLFLRDLAEGTYRVRVWACGRTPFEGIVLLDKERHRTVTAILERR